MASYIDLLGKSFWLPDPDSVSALAGDFAGIRNNIADAQSQLQALRSPGAWAEWTGQAADAFLRCLGQLPGQLSQAEESYATVTAALSGYASGLDPVVSSVRSLVPEAEEAEAVLRSATAALDHARSTGDHASVLYWEPRQRAATETVDGLTSRLGYLLGELDGLASHCVQQIGTAQHQGIQNDAITDFDRYVLMDGGTASAEAGRFAVKAGIDTWHLIDGDFIHPFTQLWPDLVDFVRQPDFHTAGTLLQDVGDVVGIIALAAVVVAVSIGSGGTADALFGAAEALGDVAMGVHIDALASNTGAVISHEPDASWTDVSNSGLSVVSDGAGEFIEDQVPGIVFGVGSGFEISAFQDGITHELSASEATATDPDVLAGLQSASGAVRGLQGLAPPPGTSSSASTMFFQPAVGVASPAAVNVQHVTISLQPAAGPGNLQ